MGFWSRGWNPNAKGQPVGRDDEGWVYDDDTCVGAEGGHSDPRVDVNELNHIKLTVDGVPENLMTGVKISCARSIFGDGLYPGGMDFLNPPVTGKDK